MHMYVSLYGGCSQICNLIPELHAPPPIPLSIQDQGIFLYLPSWAKGTTLSLYQQSSS